MITVSKKQWPSVVICRLQIVFYLNYRWFIILYIWFIDLVISKYQHFWCWTRNVWERDFLLELMGCQALVLLLSSRKIRISLSHVISKSSIHPNPKSDNWHTRDVGRPTSYQLSGFFVAPRFGQFVFPKHSWHHNATSGWQLFLQEAQLSETTSCFFVHETGMKLTHLPLA